MEGTLEQLKYPVGRFDWSQDTSKAAVRKAIETIAGFPGRIKNAVTHLHQDQLDTAYRTDGWTIRQVVHHCADSHLNAYIRFKLALTEFKPTIKPYDQTEWAKLPDSKLDPSVSLALIENIHQRWVIIMENMSDADWDLGYTHPEHNAWQELRIVVVMYAWHCEHHLAHITRLIDRMGW